MPRTKKRTAVCLALGAAACALALAFGIGACVLGAPRHRGPVSDHFDGQVFHNQNPIEGPGFSGFLKWRATRTAGHWRTWTEAPRGKKPPTRTKDGDLRVTFVNHSTVLVQIDGINILTDPIWSERCSPFSWVGPKRVRPPGIRFADLPPIDAVLISHNHYDHMDLPTLDRLAQAHHPRIFVGLGNSEILNDAKIAGSHDVDWWQSRAVSPTVTVTSVPVQHASGRSFVDRNYTLWTGWVIEGPSGKVYFAGDTGYGPHFKMAAERLGPFRLALLPIGAFRPVWFMKNNHTSPAQAVQAHLDLKAKTSVAIHFGTFPLGDDGEFEPVRELANALGLANISRQNFWVMGFGEGRPVP